MKYVGMSQSATPATGNEATRRLTPPKVAKSDHFGRTRHGHGHAALTRTAADANATSSEHTLNPQTPRVKREPLLCQLCIREKNGQCDGDAIELSCCQPKHHQPNSGHTAFGCHWACSFLFGKVTLEEVMGPHQTQRGSVAGMVTSFGGETI